MTSADHSSQSPLRSPRSIRRNSSGFSFSLRRRRSRSRSSSSFGDEERGIDDWGKSPAEQDQAIAQLRDALKSKGYSDHYGSHQLLRFIRARDYDNGKALAMFINHLEWRKENHVDSLLEEFHFTEREHYLQVYPQGYHMTDKLGRPISIQHLSKIDPKRIKEITTEDRMLKFHIREYERFLYRIAPVCSKVVGHHIDTSFAILDAKDVGIRMLTGDVRKMVSRITSMAQDHYPETMGKMCIINAPLAFRAVWGMVKPMLQPRTINKIKILGYKYMDELTKDIDIEHIPEYMGGKSPHTLLDDAGPWNDPAVLSNLNMITEEKDAESDAQIRKRSSAAHGMAPSDSRAAVEDGMGMSPSNLDQISTKTHSRHRNEQAMLPTPSHVNVDSLPSPSSGAQTTPGTLLRRVQALEEKLGQLDPERGSRDLPGAIPTSLLSRVQLLESAMATLLEAQEQRMGTSANSLDADRRGCCGCCIM